MKRLRLGIGLALALLALSAGLATAAGVYRTGHDAPQVRVVVSQGSNLAMMNVDGTGRHIVASGKSKDAFSWYSWSSDGRYLQVSKNAPQGGSSSVLLYDRNGRFVRTLVQRAPWSGLYPGWAANGDRIAYVAGACGSALLAHGWCASATDEAIYSVGVDGKKQFLVSYSTPQPGCGGGVVDPAADLYRVETDFGVTMQPLVWKIGQPLAMLTALGLTGSPTASQPGKTYQHPTEIALPRSGSLAGMIEHCGPAGCTPFVALLDPRSGAVLRTVGQGEMPAWSRDGRTIYFIRRNVERQLTFRDTSNNAIDSQVNMVSIWRAESNGAHPVRLLAERAFGFGPLSMSFDGASLVFSRVGDSGALWSHRLSGNRYNTHLLHLYGPKVTVQRLDIATGAETVLDSAGRPAVQP